MRGDSAMRLALRFALSFVTITILVWGTASYFRVKREAQLFEGDMRRDHAAVGLDLAAAVTDIWRLGGEDEAFAFVQQANASRAQVTIRLVSLDSCQYVAAGFQQRSVDSPKSAEPAPVVHILGDSIGQEWLFTIIPLVAEYEQNRAIALVESLSERDHYVRATIFKTILYTGLVSILAGSVVMLLGVAFVARPVRILIRKARRVAGGELKERTGLRQNDELGELGIELDAMSDRLADAQHQIALESTARESTLQQLRHAERLTTVGRMASSVAHELGTPLNVIRVQARMIAEREVEGEELLDSSRMIVAESTHMASIIRGLLDLSRRRPPQKERLDARDLLRQTADLVKAIARRGNVEVVMELGEVPAIVHVDPDQFRQVLSNLTVNAIEAMPHGGTLTLSLDSPQVPSEETFARRNFLTVSVADTGMGIAPHDIGRVFDPFFTTKGDQKGTGLGLSVSADIVREHGGAINLESHPGKGTIFRISLPLSHET